MTAAERISTYFVDVVERGAQKDRVVHTLGPTTRWRAGKVRDGMHINLDHERFYVVVRRCRKRSR